MKRRTRVALVGIGAVVCFGVLLSLAYPFSTSSPHAANPPGERFAVGETDAYSATGSIVVDGEARLAFEGVVTPDGGWYQKVVQDGITREEYRPSANGTIYQRLRIEDSNRATRLSERITEDEDRTLVRENSEGDRVTLFVTKNASGATEPVSGTASVFVSNLGVAGYTTEDSDTSATTVYEPQSGWYDGSEPYRITEATGTVRVGAETRAVKSANVSWTVTEPAGTYAEYLLVGLTSDEPTTHRTTFDFEPDDHDLERPSWVGEAGSAQKG